MKKIIYKTKDGVAIVNPSGEFPLEYVISRDVPEGVEYVIVEEETIPKDRSFRGAWELDKDNKLVINEEKKQLILEKNK